MRLLCSMAIKIEKQVILCDNIKDNLRNGIGDFIAGTCDENRYGETLFSSQNSEYEPSCCSDI